MVKTKYFLKLTLLEAFRFITIFCLVKSMVFYGCLVDFPFNQTIKTRTIANSKHMTYMTWTALKNCGKF